MDFWQDLYSELQIYKWEVIIDEYFFTFAMAFLAFEFLRQLVLKKMTWNIFGDAITNFVTLAAFIAINIGWITFYIGTFYYLYEYVSFIQIPINGWTIAACIILADITYYWEHRMMHRVGIGWATHTVHHSSPYFNISVAYRFGSLDGFFPILFHAPLAILGFNPVVIIFAETMVQLYQTALHTEVVKKLPRPIEAIMNTPSHHRVHHGSNPQYIDKNYAGIFIIWDKLFGTFAEEKEKVVYGVLPPINSINPLKVFFHGITKLSSNIYRAKGIKNKLAYLIKPPGWAPQEVKKETV